MVVSRAPISRVSASPARWGRRRPRRRLALALAASLSAAVSGCSVAADAPELAPPPVAPLPQAAEEPLDPLPDLPAPAAQAAFPFLDGERGGRSVSIGDTSHGRLVHARELAESDSLAILPKQRERGLRFGTDELVGLLEFAGKRLRAETGRRLWVGNLGKPEGGDIVWSVSHNAGRDADVAFCYLDAKGRPVDPGDLVAVGRGGASKDGTLTFDAAGTWRVIRALVEYEEAPLQFVFVAEHLKKRLLAHARSMGEPARVVERAAAVLRQPAGAAAHDDHLHVRLHCSERDAAGGCLDAGLVHPFSPLDLTARGKAAELARRQASDPRADTRRRALLRLGLIGGPEDVPLGAERLRDEAPEVRAAAAALIASLGSERDADSVVTACFSESDPAAMAAYFDAAGALGGAAAGALLRDWILAADAAPTLAPLEPSGVLFAPRFAEPGATERCLGPPVSGTVTFDRQALRAMAVRASTRVDRLEPVPALVALLSGEDGALATDAAHALAHITNHRLLVETPGASERDRLAAAKSGYEKLAQTLGAAPRDAWLVRGFSAAGYKVSSLDRRAAWELVRAIDREPHHSYNARRVLARWLGEPLASVGWQPGEACRHFKRAVDERRVALGVPAPSQAERRACLAPEPQR